MPNEAKTYWKYGGYSAGKEKFVDVLSGAVTVTAVSLVKVIDQVPVTVALPSVARLPVPKICGGLPHPGRPSVPGALVLIMNVAVPLPLALFTTWKKMALVEFHSGAPSPLAMSEERKIWLWMPG